MFQIQAWPRAILHLDGNAFFASVMQASYPRLRGKPVIVGAERGIATAISYEAKTYGIKRGALTSEAKKLCPGVIILQGDYELFSLYSQKMFTILRRFSPLIEEYSVDEGFADLSGMRRPLHLSYRGIAEKIQAQIKQELDLPVSVGVSLTKSLAKLASGFKKPLGITLVSGPRIEDFLALIPVENVWGIGAATTNYLHKFGVKTALEFVRLKSHSLSLNKNHLEIQTELSGNSVYALNPQAKNKYQSISKTRTFRPATADRNIVWAELLNNVEEAFEKARTYGYSVKKMAIFLKTNKFRYFGGEIKFCRKEKYPMLFREPVRQAFDKLYDARQSYRATGCVLVDLSETESEQGQLFATPSPINQERAKLLYDTHLRGQKLDFGAALYLRHHHAKEAPEKDKNLPRFSLPMLEI